MKKLATLLSGILMIAMVSCEYQTIVPYDIIIPDTPVDFATQIEPIFIQLNCKMCHTGSFKPNFEQGKVYASLISMNLVDTAHPEESILMKKINAVDITKHAGYNTTKDMTGTQKALILKWITEGAKAAIPPTSFKNEVEPIFTSATCTGCHNGSQSPDLRVNKAYASLIAKNLVVAKDPTGSKLVQYINAGHNTATKITADQKALIIKWITEGALNN